MRVLKIIVITVLFVACVFIATANMHEVRLVFPDLPIRGWPHFGDVYAPLFVVILSTLLIGVLLAGLGTLLEQVRLRTVARRSRKQRDRAFAVRDAAERERDAAVQQRDAVVQERDQARAELQQARAAIDAVKSERDVAQRELERTRSELESRAPVVAQEQTSAPIEHSTVTEGQAAAPTERSIVEGEDTA